MGSPQLLIEPRFLQALAVEPGVLDRDRRFGGQGLEDELRRLRSQGPLDPAVQVQDADATVFRHIVGCLDKAEELQRDARDVADAERDGALVRVAQRVVEEIGDQAWLAALEHLLRDLAAGFEPFPGQRGPVAPAAQLELQGALWREKHEEPAVRVGDRDRGIDDQRQDMVQHLGRAERSQAVEQRRHLPEVAHRRGRVLAGL